MTDIQQPAQPTSFLEEPRKISSTLNVLTILSFVGSGIAIIGGVYSAFTAKKSYETLLANQDALAKSPEFVKKLMGGDPVETARITMENIIPLTILNLLGAILCVYGCIQMRQLKKAGFPIYSIGELLPFVGYFIYYGSFSFGIIFSLVIAGIFIGLYAGQRKQLS